MNFNMGPQLQRYYAITYLLLLPSKNLPRHYIAPYKKKPITPNNNSAKPMSIYLALVLTDKFMYFLDHTLRNLCDKQIKHLLFELFKTCDKIRNLFNTKTCQINREM